MSLTEHEVEIHTGRRDGDGRIQVSVFAGDLVALTLEGHGERAPTLLLTLEQARKLLGALEGVIHSIESAEGREADSDAWDGVERRRLAS